MNIDRSSWIVGSARPFLAALAILSVLSLATPSASAAVSLFYTANGAPAGGTSLTSGVSTGNVTLGTFTYNITETSTDSSGLSRLNTTTINISTTAAGTLILNMTGIGYSLAGTAFNGETLQAQVSYSGTGGPAVATDKAVASASADGSNAKFGTATSLGSSTGTTGAGLSTTYSFSPTPGPITSFTVGAGNDFSLSQLVTITLAANSSQSLTIVTNAAPSLVPEPSSMAIAGLGALGMIGYGLRRRKAMGA